MTEMYRWVGGGGSKHQLLCLCVCVEHCMYIYSVIEVTMCWEIYCNPPCNGT